MDMDMDINALIAAITRSVAEQLNRDVGGQSANKRLPGVALVLAAKDAALAREIISRLGVEMRVCFQGEDPPDTPVLYVVPELSCSDMADLAQGRGVSMAMRDVLNLLLQGKTVRTLGFTFRKYAETAPHALLALYKEYEAKLASYGLTEIAPVVPETFCVRETLVTAEHVEKAIGQGARLLRVPYRAVITPLARQTAMDHNMTILNNL